VELPAIRPLITLDEDCGYNSKQQGLTPGLDTIPSMMEYADPAPDIVVRFDDVLTT